MVEAHLFQEQTKIVIRISPKRRYSSSQCEAAMNGLPGYWLMALDEVAALRRACLALPTRFGPQNILRRCCGFNTTKCFPAEDSVGQARP
jgi:hypothetical protein